MSMGYQNWALKTGILLAILRSLTLTSMLTHSDNRCVCGFAPYGRYTQIASLRSATPHTPQTLSEIAISKRKNEYDRKKH